MKPLPSATWDKPVSEKHQRKFDLFNTMTKTNEQLEYIRNLKK